MFDKNEVWSRSSMINTATTSTENHVRIFCRRAFGGDADANTDFEN